MHQSAYAGDADPGQFDALFVMDKNNYHKLTKQFPAIKRKTFFLDQQKPVSDPFGKSLPDFEACYRNIKNIIDKNFAL
jgi:protein-tyrosine-phosphatase